jgi:hypothetical protein
MASGGCVLKYQRGMNRNHLAVAAISLILLLCASASNAVMDTLSFRYDQSVFSSFSPEARQWWDPRISYRNKWKDGQRSNGEAFFLSSTTLVPLTDAWHFFKWVSITCLLIAILAPFTQIFRLRWPVWIAIFIGCEILRGTVFEALFAWGLINA